MAAQSYNSGFPNSPRLTVGLANFRSVWARWVDFSREQLARQQSVMPTPGELARNLQLFLERDEKVPWPKKVGPRVRILAEQFGFAEQELLGLDPGHGRLRVRFDEAGEKVTALHYSFRRVGNHRDESVVLHEMAHVFYGVASELAAEAENVPGGDPFALSDEIERYCWRFASEWALPRQELMRFNYARYRELLQQKGNLQPGAARLSFWGLVALAHHFSVSLRLLISALDRSQLLEQLEASVAVIANTPNLITKESADLRIVLVARPIWGHVIYNERVVRLGFSHAYRALESGRHMTPASVGEVLRLKRHTPGGKPAWSLESFGTECEYTPVDVREEGRYLVVVWTWPKSGTEAAERLPSPPIS